MSHAGVRTAVRLFRMITDGRPGKTLERVVPDWGGVGIKLAPTRVQ
jgi:hypothetical protein